MKQKELGGVDAVVLCGGLGTRLRSVVPDAPKALAAINGRAFLDILLDRIFSADVRRVVLCVGYLKEQIIEHITKESPGHPSWGEIVFSEESVPLGTGGAVKNAEGKIVTDHFFVLNGDTLVETSLTDLYRFHQDKRSMLTIAAAPVPDRSDVGSIDVRDDGRILGFRERASERVGFINAGIYMMQKELFRHMPEGVFSLEQDFFPKAVGMHHCFAFTASADVIDIGTPERYHRANELFS